MSFYSKNEYTGDGTQVLFSLSFPYLDRSHVELILGEDEEEAPAAFTWINDGQIEANVAPADGVKVQVRRNTPKSASLVDFVDTAMLTETDLDTMQTQLIYIVQELLDSGLATSDAVKAMEEAVEILHGETEGFRNEAMGFSTLAQRWAEEAEDTEVEPGQYSALHHALKAAASAVAASAAQVDAEAAQAVVESARDKAQDWAEEEEDVEVEEGKYSAKHWATKAIVNVALIEENVAKAAAWAEEVEDTEVEAGKYSALHHAAKADASATTAGLSETAAGLSETAAGLSEAAAEAARDKAEDWAEEAEDTEVETGRYSAKHHALKAAASAATVADQVFANKNALDTLVPTTPGKFLRVNAAGDGYDEESATTAPVDSVNGKTGAVVLDPTDVGAAASDHNHDGDYEESGTTSTHESTYTHTDIALNTTDRHSHTNKPTLDAVPDHSLATTGHVLAKAAGGGLEFVEQTGGGGDDVTTYKHSQTTAATTWTINHNLNSEAVMVQVYNGDNKMVVPDEIEITSANQVVVTFSPEVTGKAVIIVI